MIFDACFPRFCIVCNSEGSLLCAVCIAELSLDGPPFAYANPVIRQLICAWKYDGDQDGLRILAALVRPRLEPLYVFTRAMSVDAIVPIPLSLWKERWRGFHQVRDLSRVIGAELKIPVTDILTRHHRLSAQANLSRDVRKTSLKINPLALKRGSELPKRALLIDDVETTGATMNAAEEVLKEAGIEMVFRWSLARG